MNTIDIPILSGKKHSNKSKKWKLAGILLGYLSVFSVYSLPVAFFPLLAQERGISSLSIGLVFSFFPIGGFTSSLFFGKQLSFIKRQILARILSILLFIAVLGFGCIVLITNNLALIIIASFCRLVQGISMGGLLSIMYSSIFTIYQSQMVQVICACEISLAFSMAAFVNLGKYLYDEVGFTCPFIIIGIISLIGLMVSSLAFSNTTLTNQKVETLNYGILWKNRNFLLILACIISVISTKTFTLSTMTQHIQDIPGGKDMYGIAFMLINAGFIAINLIFMLGFSIIVKLIRRRTLLLLGMSFLIISVTIYFPLSFLGIPSEINLTLAFAFFIGFSSAIFYVPSLPELVNSASIKSTLDPLFINDTVSGIFSASMLGSEVVGPFFGGLLIDEIGFPKTGICFVAFLLLFFLLYMIFGKPIKFRKRRSAYVSKLF